MVAHCSLLLLILGDLWPIKETAEKEKIVLPLLLAIKKPILIEKDQIALCLFIVVPKRIRAIFNYSSED